jgi:Tfp pilus assembly protein PilF
MEPNNASAYNQRGTAWYYKKNDERAIKDFSEAIRIKPDYALAWHNRGTAYRMAGNTNAANTDFAQASKLGYK